MTLFFVFIFGLFCFCFLLFFKFLLVVITLLDERINNNYFEIDFKLFHCFFIPSYHHDYQQNQD